MENGKINYVQKNFNRAFYAKPIGQTFWIELKNATLNPTPAIYRYLDNI